MMFWTFDTHQFSNESTWNWWQVRELLSQWLLRPIPAAAFVRPLVSNSPLWCRKNWCVWLLILNRTISCMLILVVVVGCLLQSCMIFLRGWQLHIWPGRLPEQKKMPKLHRGSVGMVTIKQEMTDSTLKTQRDRGQNIGVCCALAYVPNWINHY